MDDAAYERAKLRMRKLSAAFAYPGARRISRSYLLRVSQAVYITPDSLGVIDVWYREKLEVGGDAAMGVMFNADGRRWSFFRDGFPFRNEDGHPTVATMNNRRNG